MEKRLKYTDRNIKNIEVQCNDKLIKAQIKLVRDVCIITISDSIKAKLDKLKVELLLNQFNENEGIPAHFKYDLSNKKIICSSVIWTSDITDDNKLMDTIYSLAATTNMMINILEVGAIDYE